VKRSETPEILQTNGMLWSRPGFLVRRLHQICVAIFLEECAEVRLTPIQWAILTVVERTPRLGYSSIAAQVGLDRSNTANVVRRLAERGWIRQEPSTTDKRMLCVELTPTGHKLLTRLRPQLKRSQDRVFEALSEKERRVFKALLTRLIVHNNAAGRAHLHMDETLLNEEG
jgi:DNA-binding MarR family transcriptional regulator